MAPSFGGVRGLLATKVSISMFLVFFLCSLLSSVNALSADDGDERPVLSPIHIDDFEEATGFAKRTENDAFDFMTPATQAHLSYGRPAGTRDFFFIFTRRSLNAPLAALSASRPPLYLV